MKKQNQTGVYIRMDKDVYKAMRIILMTKDDNFHSWVNRQVKEYIEK